MKKLGPIISKIRKNKNIPVQHLIRNKMSRSTYTRFTEGNIDVSANKFIILVHRLNLSLGEFEYIANNYHSPSVKYRRELQAAITSFSSSKSLTKLIFLKNNLPKRSHYYYLSCLFIERLSHHHLNQKYFNLIKHYLLSRSSWTFYELNLFDDISPFLNLKLIINIFLKRILKDLNKYNNYTTNENTCIRLIVNISSICLYNNQPKLANLLMTKIHNYPLSQNMLIEKLGIKYIKSLLMIINKNKSGYYLLQQSLNCLKATNPQDYYLALKHYANLIINKYHTN